MYNNTGIIGVDRYLYTIIMFKGNLVNVKIIKKEEDYLQNEMRLLSFIKHP